MRIYQSEDYLLISNKRKYFIFDTITFNLSKVSYEFFKQIKNNSLKEPYIKEWKYYLQNSKKIQKAIIKNYDDYFQKECTSNVVINITNDCNMRCLYCFADEGRYWSDIRANGNELDVKKLIKFIKKYYKQKEISVTYFGGEPLIAMDKMKEITDNLKKNYEKVSISLTTNAIALNNNKIVDYLIKEDIYPLISFDGFKKVQDKQRPLPGRKASFEKVISGIENYVRKTGRKVNIRATLYPGDTDIIELYKFFEDLNYVNESFIQYALPNNQDDENKFLKDLKKHKDNYKKYFEFIKKKLLNNEFIKDGKIIRDFGILVNRKQKIRGCGAGSGSFSVMNNGKIFPCYKINTDKFLMGTIEKGLKEKRQDYSIFNQENVKCKECWARLICGGGCPGEGIFIGNNLSDKSDYVCEMEKNFLTGLLKIITDIYIEDKEKYEELFTNKVKEIEKNNFD